MTIDIIFHNYRNTKIITCKSINEFLKSINTRAHVYFVGTHIESVPLTYEEDIETYNRLKNEVNLLTISYGDFYELPTTFDGTFNFNINGDIEYTNYTVVCCDINYIVPTMDNFIFNNTNELDAYLKQFNDMFDYTAVCNFKDFITNLYKHFNFKNKAIFLLKNR